MIEKTEVEKKMLELGRALVRAARMNGLELLGHGDAGRIEIMGKAMEIAARKQIPEKYAAPAIAMAMEGY